MKLGEIPASSTASITLQNVPQVLHFNIGTVPTALKVNVNGDGVLCDLDGAGIQAATRLFRVGNVADEFFIVLADGFVKNKDVTITIANAHAGILSLYGYSEKYASVYIQSIQNVALQSTPKNFDKFFSLAFPDITDSDDLNVTYNDGFTDKYAPSDLRTISSVDTYTDSTDADFRLPNQTARIKAVNFIAAAQQQVYQFRYANIGNLTR